MSADDDMRAMIARIRSIPNLAKESAPEVAEVVQKSIEGSITRGETPEGEKWQLTQEGKQPLVNAAKALRVTSLGTKIIAVVHGPEARHSLGRARGKIQRRILPEKTVPKDMGKEIGKVLATEFKLWMGGGK